MKFGVQKVKGSNSGGVPTRSARGQVGTASSCADSPTRADSFHSLVLTRALPSSCVLSHPSMPSRDRGQAYRLTPRLNTVCRVI